MSIIEDEIRKRITSLPVLTKEQKIQEALDLIKTHETNVREHLYVMKRTTSKVKRSSLRRALKHERFLIQLWKQEHYFLTSDFQERLDDLGKKVEEIKKERESKC